MAEISAASQEQTSGFERMSRAITDMDQATQQNAALVEEAAAAAQAMQEQAGELSQLVSIFKVDLQFGATAVIDYSSTQVTSNGIGKTAISNLRRLSVAPHSIRQATMKTPITADDAWEEF